MWIKFINTISVMIVQEDVLQYFITEKQIVFIYACYESHEYDSKCICMSGCKH